MDQETINRAYSALASLAEIISSDLRTRIDEIESSGCQEEFRMAQKFKESANLLDSQSARMKRSYPHLFNGKQG